MNILSKIVKATELFRTKFGPFRGSLLWMDLMREKLLPTGSVFAVSVPGLPNKVFLRAKTSDAETLCQIFLHRELDIEVHHPVAYIIDAGANIGLASVYLANRYPDADIDALEVDSSNMEIIRLNVAPYRKVRVIQMGLWSHKTTLKISNPDAQACAFRVQEVDSNDPSSFESVSVSDLLAERCVDSVDILKIDIEGAEREVFSASAEWIDRARTIFVECHDRFKPGCVSAVQQACAGRTTRYLLSGEYHVYTIGHTAS